MILDYMLLLLEILVHLYVNIPKKHEKIDWLVAELSSYQIEIFQVKPNIGIWTTFTEDHRKDIKQLKTTST